MSFRPSSPDLFINMAQISQVRMILADNTACSDGAKMWFSESALIIVKWSLRVTSGFMEKNHNCLDNEQPFITASLQEWKNIGIQDIH